ncbi:hypothetical protein JCM8202_000100 [Rhodotorula sphaerocarpa]
MTTTATEVLPVQHSDLPTVADIIRDAFADTSVSRLVWGDCDPDEIHRVQVQKLAERFKDPYRQHRKAVRGNEVVAASISAEIDSTREDKVEEPGPTLQGKNVELFKEWFGLLDGLIGHYKLRDPKYHHLTVLVVSPKAQRSGAGTALMQAFVDEADKADLPSYLEATAYGEGLYRRFGFVQCAERARCGPDGSMHVLPMRRPSKSERNASKVIVQGAFEDDALPLAHMHNSAFAPDPFVSLIWGKVDRGEADRSLAIDFTRRRDKIRRADAIGFAGPVGMALAYRVGVEMEQKSAREGQTPAEEEIPHPEGTDVELFKEFMGMLDRVRAGFRERDARFYHLEILAVVPEGQRRGFGQALLEAVLADADRENLPVCLEASAVGTGLYRKHGFVECAPRASCGPNDEISVLPMRRPPQRE